MPYFLAEQVFNPNKVYKGQKLTRLVRTKTAASTINTMPNVPVMVLLKYSTTTTAAINRRTIRSTVPMFFFIIVNFDFL